MSTNDIVGTPRTFSQIGTGLAFGLMIHCATTLAQDARFFRIAGPVVTTITDLAPDGTVTWTNVPTNATFTVQTRTDLAAGDWLNWVQVPVSNATTAHRLFDLNTPEGMRFIPSGAFTMGDSFGEGMPNELPLHTVYVSMFYMDRYEVTKMLWDDVYQ